MGCTASKASSSVAITARKVSQKAWIQRSEPHGKPCGILSPILDTYLGTSHGKGVKKALEGYDELKSRAVRAHGQGEEAFKQIRAEVPQLNFGAY